MYELDLRMSWHLQNYTKFLNLYAEIYGTYLDTLVIDISQLTTKDFKILTESMLATIFALNKNIVVFHLAQPIDWLSCEHHFTIINI